MSHPERNTKTPKERGRSYGWKPRSYVRRRISVRQSSYLLAIVDIQSGGLGASTQRAQILRQASFQ